jgi:predicted MFS family arabinose efflux permease
VEGLSEVVGFRKSRIPLLMLLGGIAGLVGGFALQYWVHVINYPINIGGKPLNSVPMWVPITFETTVLLAALTGVLAMILLNGLPAPYHPLFNVAEFARASQDRFFLAIEATDPRFDMTQTRRFLESLGPASVHEVLP